MSYTPINVSVYVAAYAGAAAAMSISNRVISSVDTATYEAQIEAAGAFAQSFDMQWSTRTTTTLDLTAITQGAAQSYILRSPNSIRLSDYTSIVAAIITEINASENYFATQGIVPPLPNTGGGAGVRKIPPVDAFSAIRWEFELMTDGNAPPYGATPPQPLASTGTQAVNLTNGFSGGSGGGVIEPGPFGRAYDFYAASGAIGGSGSGNDPWNPGNNNSLTLEAGFYARGNPVNVGVILTKAFKGDGSTWGPPYNTVGVTYANNTTINAWEIGMTDTADPSTEIGVDVTDGRSTLRPQDYNHLMLVIDTVLHRGFGYLNGTKRAFFTFTAGPAYFAGPGSGPWQTGGNIVNTSDCANIVLDYLEVANVARTPAEALARAQSYLGYIIPNP